MTGETARDGWDAIILGGGAAGLFCAARAGARGKRVLLLEHNERVGVKIGISGGGRCNFTNIHASADNYLSNAPEFCKSALARFGPWDFVALVEEHGIGYHEKKLGQLFCNESSRAIIGLLIAECARAGVRILTGTTVHEVTKEQRFSVRSSGGSFEAAAVVVATGGLSFPKLGATGIGYNIAEHFGLPLVKPRPGLVPLTLPARELGVWGALSGLSVPVTARVAAASFEENILFTHRGVSGPATLQVSSHWDGAEPVVLELIPERETRELLAKHRHEARGLPDVLGTVLPRRFAETWCASENVSGGVNRFTNAELEELARRLARWPLPCNGTEGYPKAEVTVGGVDTRALSSRTMEARTVPGLYFIGEVVDVTGWLGGYNFQWAWASAAAAAAAL
jgi:predicted Rossmann fold flavoprotein